MDLQAHGHVEDTPIEFSHLILKGTWPRPWIGTAVSYCLVLVVEDDLVARKYIRATLQQAGFQVMEASSGEEALELFELHPPRVVLLDLGLPGINGFDVCQKMR